MKISTTILALATGATISGIALAQDQAAVSAEKQAGIKTLVPGLYGKVEARHSFVRKMNNDEIADDAIGLSLRPMLGATLFSDAVDTQFTFPFVRTDAVKMTKGTVFNDTTWTWLKGSLGSVGAYAYTEFNNDGTGFKFSNVGLNSSFDQKFPVAGLGDLQLQGYVEPKVQIMSKSYAATDEAKKTPRNETGKDKFALNEKGDEKLEQRDPTLLNDTGVAALVHPALVKGLSTGVSIDVGQEWKPKYVAEAGAADIAETEFDGYEARAYTMTRFLLNYKLTDKVTLGNQLRHYTGGLYERGIDDSTIKAKGELPVTRWENRLSLTATLF